MYKIIVCGGRDFNDRDFLFKKLEELINNLPFEYKRVIQIVEGGNKTMLPDGAFIGADYFAAEFAEAFQLEHKPFPYIRKLGKQGGVVRNQHMADYGDVCVAFWDGKSRGTRDMIDRAERKGLAVKIFYYNQ